jgi:hypothetical protein
MAAYERLRPAEQLADPVPGFPIRPLLARLEFPVLADADAEAPGRLSHRPARPAPILLQHLSEHRDHRGEGRPFGDYVPPESEKPPEPEGPSGFSMRNLVAWATACQSEIRYCDRLAGIRKVASKPALLLRGREPLEDQQ